MIYYFPPLLWLYYTLGVTHYVWGALLTAPILAFATVYGRNARSDMSLRRVALLQAQREYTIRMVRASVSLFGIAGWIRSWKTNS